MGRTAAAVAEASTTDDVGGARDFDERGGVVDVVLNRSIGSVERALRARIGMEGYGGRKRKDERGSGGVRND